MLNRRQRETLQAIEEQLVRDDPGLNDRFAAHRTHRRTWKVLAAVSLLVLVASIVAGYPAGAVWAAAGLALAWRLRATRPWPAPGPVRGRWD